MDDDTESPAAPFAGNDERPTRVRYVIVFVTFLAAVLLYLHRFCISYAQVYIKEDLHLSDAQLGFCFSAFFFAYALGQVPSGWLSDRFGARRMLTAYILVWSLFTALMGVTMGFVMLFAVRMAAGLGQAGAYPTSAGLLSKWIPFSTRGTASSLVAFGGRLGAAAAPIATWLLIVAFVPLSTDPLLKTDDLLDAYPLAASVTVEQSADVVKPTDVKTPKRATRSIDRYLLNLMPDREAVTLQSLAEEFTAYRAAVEKHEKKVAAGKGKTAKEPLRPEPEPNEIERLRTALNVILVDRDFYRRDDFRDIAVERECQSLMKRDPASLSVAEVRRRNRLLLEAAYPDSIGKLYVHGWRPVMITFGSLGLFVAALFWLLFRDWPSAHRWCNRAEVDLVEQGQPQTAPSRRGRVRAVPIREILSSRSLWLMCATQWGSNVGWVFLVTWLPRYLLEVHNAPLSHRSVMASLPLFVGWGGMLLGGWATDRFTRGIGLRWGRVLPLATGRFLAMSAYLLCLIEPSAWTVTMLFAVVAFSSDLGSASLWAYKQDVGGPYVGSIHGWANMWGNLGATISPVLLQFVFGNFGWNAAFATCAAAYCVSGLCSLGVDARIPIAPREDGEE